MSQQQAVRSPSVEIINDILNFFKSSEWQLSINMFVEANCRLFLSKDYSHSHFDYWKKFQETVDQILHEALLTCSTSSSSDGIADLERVLERVILEPATGPRDDRIKELIKQLLTYHDFMSFAEMMKTQAELQDIVEINENLSIASNRSSLKAADKHPSGPASTRNHRQQGSIDQLISFGFPRVLVSQVMSDERYSNKSVEELVAVLADLNEQSYSENNTDMRDASGHQLVSGEEVDYNTIGASQRLMEVFAKEVKQWSNMYKDAHHNSDDDIMGKFKLAASVSEILDDGTSNMEVGSLLRWAVDMLCLQRDVLLTSEASDYGQFVDRYMRLENDRQRIDYEASGQHVLSDAEVARMIALSDVAAQGTADEQLLHQYLLRYDDVHRDIVGYHQRVAIYVSKDQCISKHSLEELYIYLKNQISSGVDLASISDEMHGRVLSYVAANRVTEVVNTLLELHILEDEQVILRQQINILTSIVCGASAVDASSYESIQEPFDYLAGICLDPYTAAATLDVSELTSEDKSASHCLTEKAVEHKNLHEHEIRRLASNHPVDRKNLIDEYFASQQLLMNSLSNQKSKQRLKLLHSLEEKKRKRMLLSDMAAMYLPLSSSVQQDDSHHNILLQNNDCLEQVCFSIDDDLHKHFLQAAEVLDNNKSDESNEESMKLADSYLKLQTTLWESYDQILQHASQSYGSAMSAEDAKNQLLQVFMSSKSSFQQSIDWLQQRASASLAKRLQHRSLHSSAKSSSIIEDEDEVKLLNDISNDPMLALGLLHIPNQHNHIKSLIDESEARSNRQMREALLAVHTQKEIELVQGLHDQMLRRKIALHERIVKKGEMKNMATTDDKKEMEADDEIMRLEGAFESILAKIRDKKVESSNLNMSDLLKLLDRMMTGNNDGDVNQVHVDVMADAKSAPAARQPTPSITPTEIDRSFFQQEARRISAFAADEQQKHDLTLKMQQAREKQNLQRKLMERRNMKVREQQTRAIRTAAGPESVNSFQSSSLSPKQQQQQLSMRSMMSRGLSLSPMLRK